MAFIYQYYVEGENEKKLVEVLSKEFNFIKAGKVEVLNVVEKPIKNTRIRNFKENYVIILVFDTDTNNTKTLEAKKCFDFKKLWRTNPVGVFSGFKCELSKLENKNF